MSGNLSRRLSPADWRAAAAVAVAASLLALLALWPIGPGNDQALFLYYARAMRDGATLYADLWDNKPPGIFAFYVGAAALFGDGWGAVRLAFALWLGLGAGAIAALCRIVAPGRMVWALAPALTVGLALLRLDAERPAQVESLLPTLLAILMLLIVLEPASPLARSMRWIGAGLLVGGVAAFKPVLVPVALSLCAVGLGWRIVRGELSMRTGMITVGLGIAGAALALLPIAVWVERHQVIREFLWTMLRYPQLALVEVPMQKPAMLIAALRWLAVTCGLLLPAAALFAWRARAGVSTLIALMGIAWLTSGLAMILMQRFSWWDTHMDLVVWPIGLMAAFGIDLNRRRSLSRPTIWLRVEQLVSVLAIGAMVVHGARFLQAASRASDWPRPAIERDALETAHTVMTTSLTPCGTVYAIGDQAGVERETGLRQAIATHGLWFGAFLPSQVRRLPAELEAARPDLVYVDGAERLDLAARYPAQARAIEHWLARDYLPGAIDALQGQWWQRRITPQAMTGCPVARRFFIPADAAASAMSATATGPQ